MSPTGTSVLPAQPPAPDAAGPVGPPARVHLGRGARVAVGVLAVLAVVLLIGTISASGPHGHLDPGSADPDGGRALRVLLEQQGVEVDVVADLASAPAAGDDNTTYLVTDPAFDDPQALRGLMQPGAFLVVTDPDPTTVELLAPGVSVGRQVQDAVRDPACDWRPTVRAGRALSGGVTMTGQPAQALELFACYAVGGEATVLRVTGQDRVDVTLVGSGDAFTNQSLGDDGNAALALNMLGSRPRLVWLSPEAAQVPPAEGGKDFGDLLPPWVGIVVAQLVVAVLVLALWRGRRLGPVVVEALPVDVRAAETTEGRARMYRRRSARDRAAGHLRAATVGRLLGPLGLPPGSSREAVAGRVAARSGWSPGDVAALLYGAAPRDDAGLVRLASDLDSLERQVRRP